MNAQAQTTTDSSETSPELPDNLDELGAATASPIQQHKRLRLRSLGQDTDSIIELGDAELILGRKGSVSSMAEDIFASPSHCSIRPHANVVELADLGSLNGTWLKVQNATVVKDGQSVRLGKQYFTLKLSASNHTDQGTVEDGTQRIDAGSPGNEWMLVSQEDSSVNFCRVVPSYGLRIGRLSGNLVFEDDAELDALHAILMPNANGVSIRDLNSHTGTWIRLESPTSISDGAEFLVGKTRIKLEL